MQTCVICQHPKDRYITIFKKHICSDCQNSFCQDDMDDYNQKVSLIREVLLGDMLVKGKPRFSA